MRIKLNGEPRDLDDAISISQLISNLKLKPEQVAVELNGEVIRRLRWDETLLQDGDRVEVVHFVGGGEPGSGRQGHEAGQEAGAGVRTERLLAS